MDQLTFSQPSESELPLPVVERAPTENAPAPGRRRRRGALLMGLVVLLGLAVGGHKVMIGREQAASTTAPVAPPSELVGLGKLLPESGVLTVAAPYGAGDARIRTVAVNEGDRVQAGDVIAVLDNESSLLAAVEAARANIESRKASRVQVQGSVRAGRGELAAQLARAQVVLDSARTELRRTRTLHAEGVATERELEQRNASYEEAAREVQRLRASQGRYATRKGVQADVLVAQRNLDASRAELQRALANLDQAYIRAPIDGTILRLYARPGERPGTAGVVDLGNVDRMKVEVEVHESHASRVRLGMRVSISARALPEPLGGRVVDLGHLVTRQENIGRNPAAHTDARVVRVTVLLEEGDLGLARRLSQLQVTARFRLFEET